MSMFFFIKTVAKKKGLWYNMDNFKGGNFMGRGKLILAIIFALIIGTTTVYAYNEDSLKIKSGDSSGLDVRYENIKILKQKNSQIKFTEEEYGINFSTFLKTPGDYVEFSFDIVNYNNTDIEIGEILKSNLSEQEQRYLKYVVSYIDDREIEKGQILKEKEKKTIKVRIEYKYDITAEELPTTNTILDISYNIFFYEA